MPQDQSSHMPADRTRINLNEEKDVRYWCDTLNCRPDELRVAVNSVGESVADVRIYLGTDRKLV